MEGSAACGGFSSTGANGRLNGLQDAECSSASSHSDESFISPPTGVSLPTTPSTNADKSNVGLNDVSSPPTAVSSRTTPLDDTQSSNVLPTPVSSCPTAATSSTTSIDATTRTVNPPGSAGRTVLSDRSLEMWRDPVGFVARGMLQHASRAFTTRLLLRPTVVLGDNEAVRQLLNDPDTFQGGLRDLFMPLFGENLVFMEGELARTTRQRLHDLFNAEATSHYQKITERVLRNWADELDTDQPVDVYAAFKRLSMDLNMAVFLGLERKHQPQRVSDITAAATTHWHGLYSVPVSVTVPLVTSSTYKKAMEAKQTLLDLAGKLLQQDSQSAFVDSLKLLVEDEETRRNHLLLCCSALVPKALASLLTSVVVASPHWKMRYVDTDGHIPDAELDCVLLEVQRLFPPFFGGRRLATADACVAGYRVQKGQAVVYGTEAAHRDPAVFPHPDSFDPARWRAGNKNDKDKLFCFGGGPRSCIGQRMYEHILKMAFGHFVSTFDWSLPSDWRPSWKHMPVTRPTNLPPLRLTRRRSSQRWHDAV